MALEANKAASNHNFENQDNIKVRELLNYVIRAMCGQSKQLSRKDELATTS